MTHMEKPRTIHDFYGFPPALFEVQYPAPGSPETADLVRATVKEPSVQPDDETWGLDHGTWSVLAHMYPQADVPVVQLAIDATKPLQYHLELGAKLAPLMDESVLVVASGNVVHNLRALNPQIKAYDWAQRFDDLVRDTIVAGDFDKLIAFDTLGQDARYSIPTAEHFLPLLYILGAKGADDSTEVICHDTAMGSISMTSYIFHRA
mgnify:CR=1 FL=1